MIINYPTGFYRTAIITDPDIPSNITFTISNGPPPRTELLFVKTPVALGIRGRLARVHSEIERRDAVSLLAYSTATNRNSNVSFGAKQFESGQTLDFDNDNDNISVDPMLVSQTTEVKHDTNLLDLSSLGIDDDTQSVINNESTFAYNSLLDDLNEVVGRRANYEADLRSTQKSLNEAIKAIDGLDGVLEVVPDNQSLISARFVLIQKRDDLLVQQSSLIDSANLAAAEAIVIRDKMVRVAQLVR